MGDIQGAIAAFSNALRLNPDHLPALNNRAAAYSMAHQPDLALADLNHAELLKPGDLETMFMRGRVLMLTGQKAAGCELISQAIAEGFTKATEFYTKACRGGADSTAQSRPK